MYPLYDNSNGKYCVIAPLSSSSSSSSSSSNALILLEKVKDKPIVSFTVMTLSQINNNDDDNNNDNNSTNVYHLSITYNDIKTQINETWDYDNDDDKYISHFENATINNKGITIKIIGSDNDNEIELQFSYFDESESESMFKKTIPIHRRNYSNLVYSAFESTICLYEYTRQHLSSPSTSMPLVQQGKKRANNSLSDETKQGDGNGKKNKKPKVVVYKNTGVNI